MERMRSDGSRRIRNELDSNRHYVKFSLLWLGKHFNSFIVDANDTTSKSTGKPGEFEWAINFNPRSFSWVQYPTIRSKKRVPSKRRPVNIEREIGVRV